ncbi:MAG TPA: ABC transporter permease [Bryobacteraceae bacterium]|nr:ABC transporter permease [Bryobacteraceae bacterium]
MDGLLQDLRYGLRSLILAPGFTAVAVVTLALGIGANSAIFSVINGVLLKPLPYRQPERLVRVFTSFPAYPEFPVNQADFRDYRNQNRVFDRMALYVREDLQFAANERPERLNGMRVTPGFFELLGFRPMLGRTFLPSEELPGNEGEVILGNGMWKSRFSGDRGVIGRTVRLSGRAFTIVGVMPSGLESVGGTYHSLPHGEHVDVWWPLTLDPKQTGRGSHYLNGIARLKPGVNLAEAMADMNGIAENLGKLYPETNRNARIKLVGLRKEIVGQAQPLLLILLGAVGFVLLIACVNVANLLLARAVAREREMAVRTALGAGRLRLARQLLTESLVIAVVGGVAGLLISIWGVDALTAASAGKLPRVQMVGVDGRMFAFTCAVTILTGLLFGLAPAVQLSKTSLHDSLKEGGRSATSGPRRNRLRSVLVVAELALALVLLVGGGLLMRTFVNLERVPAGFEPRGVLTLSIDLPRARYPDSEHAAAFYKRLLERIEAQPGVRSAGVTSDLPWTGYDENSDFQIPGRSQAENDQNHARYHFVSEHYFQTIGVPLISGRFFNEHDKNGAPAVVLINQSMARRYWPKEDAAGKPVNIWGKKAKVVGIVGDVKDFPGSIGAEPAYYWALQQEAFGEMRLAIRGDASEAALLGIVERELAAVDRELPVADVKSLDEIAVAAVAGPRLSMLLVGIFAALAMALATIGIYGVISYMVSQRIHEIGVRLALGAQFRDVLRLVVGEGLKLAGIGVAAGLAAALALHSMMKSLLYGVSATDPVTFAGVSLVLMAVAGAACYIPARRATRVDPMVALRYE